MALTIIVLSLFDPIDSSRAAKYRSSEVTAAVDRLPDRNSDIAFTRAERWADQYATCSLGANNAIERRCPVTPPAASKVNRIPASSSGVRPARAAAPARSEVDARERRPNS